MSERGIQDTKTFGLLKWFGLPRALAYMRFTLSAIAARKHNDPRRRPPGPRPVLEHHARRLLVASVGRHRLSSTPIRPPSDHGSSDAGGGVARHHISTYSEQNAIKMLVSPSTSTRVPGCSFPSNHFPGALVAW